MGMGDSIQAGPQPVSVDLAVDCRHFTSPPSAWKLSMAEASCQRVRHAASGLVRMSGLRLIGVVVS